MTACPPVYQIACPSVVSVFTTGAITGTGADAANAIAFAPDQLSNQNIIDLVTAMAASPVGLANLAAALQSQLTLNTATFVTTAGNASLPLTDPSTPPVSPTVGDVHWELWDDYLVAYQYVSGDWIQRLEIPFGYPDSSAISHDLTTGFVADEHVDHTAVVITAGEGLAGGGDIAASFALDIDLTELAEVTAVDTVNDFAILYSNAAGAHRKIRPQYLENFPGTSNPEVTLAAGEITKTSKRHTVDTEADAASDDLDTINGGAEGDILILRANNDARTVVVKHATGNIYCGADISLDSVRDTVILIKDSGIWLLLASSNNGT